MVRIAFQAAKNQDASNTGLLFRSSQGLLVVLLCEVVFIGRDGKSWTCAIIVYEHRLSNALSDPNTHWLQVGVKGAAMSTLESLFCSSKQFDTCPLALTMKESKVHHSTLENYR